jgi:TolB-like protein
LPDLDATTAAARRPSVFLSYASQDRDSVRSLRDVLAGFGLEVWFDENELAGGDAWDQKLRRQIRECDYFMPVVSAQTEARREGYFRREWRLAVERTLDMADDHLFLLPVLIDETGQSTARVPEKFHTVQWLKVPDGRATPALEALCRRLRAGGESVPAGPPLGSAEPGISSTAATEATGNPLTVPRPREATVPFPHQEAEQRVKYWFEVAGWAVRMAWARFKTLPRWVRIFAYVWVGIALISRCDQGSHREAADISPEKVEKLKAISKNYQGDLTKQDVVQLGKQIAKEFTDDGDAGDTASSPLMAVAFTAPADDPAAEKFADASFAMTYGRVAISHKGKVALTKEAASAQSLAAAIELAKANHSEFVLYGNVVGTGAARALTVDIAKVADGSVVWTNTYPIDGADASKIAAEVDAKIPDLPNK